MKIPLPAVLVPLAVVCGLLLSSASWVGRTGINILYRQYGFLNVWWQAALAVLAVWLVFYGVQHLRVLRTNGKAVKRYYLIASLACLAGFAFAYYDFQTTTTHRWLGKAFHGGVYLFFLGWALVLFDGWRRRQKSRSQQP